MSLVDSLRDAITDDTPAPRTPTIAVDDAIEVLRNERRRIVLDILARVDDDIEKRDLARHVAAIENRQHPDRVTSDDRQTVYVCLHQTHLPQLDDAGIIDYDDQRGTIEATHRAEALADAKHALHQSLRGERA